MDQDILSVFFYDV